MDIEGGAAAEPTAVDHALDALSTEQFRTRLGEDIRKFSTRTDFDSAVWDDFAKRLHYIPGNFGDADSYRYLVESIRRFPKPAAFADMIRAAGFLRVSHQTLSGGIVALHSGWRL